MLHACAHNPTGVDPTHEQWVAISAALKGRPLALFFDSAYQGFASGDAEHDAFSVRQFVRDGHSFALAQARHTIAPPTRAPPTIAPPTVALLIRSPSLALAQSFAKNFGLYGERVGLLSMVCGSAEEAERIESQLKLVIRPMYSNPPIHGARIVEEVLGDPKPTPSSTPSPTPSPSPSPSPTPNAKQVLGDPKLEAQWRAECSQMAERIIAMRAALSKALTAAGSTRDWSHVTSQIGMFCFSGM